MDNCVLLATYARLRSMVVSFRALLVLCVTWSACGSNAGEMHQMSSAAGGTATSANQNSAGTLATSAGRSAQTTNPGTQVATAGSRATPAQPAAAGNTGTTGQTAP